MSTFSFRSLGTGQGRVTYQAQFRIWLSSDWQKEEGRTDDILSTIGPESNSQESMIHLSST
jgi:hypothetical protein